MTPLRKGGAAALAVALCAGPAMAHAPIPGIKGFYIGALHPFSTPPQALMMLGAGLLVAGHAVDRAKFFFAGFAITSLLGLFTGQPPAWLDTAMYAAAALVCALAALLPGRVLPGATLLTALCGLLIGMASVPDPGPARDMAFTMSGALFGANLGLLYIWGGTLFLKERIPQDWLAIGLRILAAWIGAIALLMLALAYAPAV